MNQSVSVLHIVESFGGGVASALHQYAASTPWYKHHLLRTEREGDFIDSGEANAFLTVREMPRRGFSAIRSIRQTINELQPDVLHVHSSYAGLYVRISTRAKATRPIVYTPHGYASERADIPWIAAKLFRGVEALLTLNTTRIAACSPREASLSRFAGFGGKVVYVPNVADINVVAQASNSTARDKRSLHVVTVGRLTPARDPMFYRDVVKAVKRAGGDVTFTWIGGGDERYRNDILDVGVGVTGWLSRADAFDKLRTADVHLHPAAWDGFPMVLLEANALGIPSLVRDIPAFRSFPPEVKFESATAVADHLLSMAESPGLLPSTLQVWNQILIENKAEVQAERLTQAYELPGRGGDR